MGEVLHGSLLQLLLEHCDCLYIDISQGSAATRLRCGGIFKYELVANLPVSLPVKEFWKSVNISGSYGQVFGVLFFSETQCITRYQLELILWQPFAADCANRRNGPARRGSFRTLTTAWHIRSSHWSVIHICAMLEFYWMLLVIYTTPHDTGRT